MEAQKILPLEQNDFLYCSMSQARISIGKIALEFLHNFNFNTNLLTNIWYM